MGRQSRAKAARVRTPPLAGASPPPRAARPAAPLPPTPWSALWQELGRDALALFGLAMAVRIAALVLIARTPYLEVDNIDSKGYQIWAQQILTQGWLPTGHFYQSPLYAYYLALVYAVFGTGPWAPRLIQVVVGSVNVALIYAITRQLFSRRVGVLAALLLCFYGPLLLEEIVLSKTALVMCTGLLGFALFVRYYASARPAGLYAAGGLLGLTVVGAGQWLPAVLALAAYAIWVARRRRAEVGVTFLAGVGVVLVPMALWNSLQGGGVMLTSGDAGLNLYLGNNPLTTGLPGRPFGLRDIPEFEEDDSRRLAEKEVGHPLTPAGVSQHWSGRAAAFAFEHPSDFIATTVRKLVVLWNGYEIPDSYHFAFMRAEFLPLLWGCATFSLVAPLALAGLVLERRRRAAWPLYIVCLGYLATATLFYVRSRYRMAAVPFLVPFAAATVDRLWSDAAARRWSAAVAPAALLLVAALFVNRPYCEPEKPKIPALCMQGDLWFDLEWLKLAEFYESRGDLPRARAASAGAAACSSPRSVGQIYAHIGNLEVDSGDAAATGGDAAAARQHYERAIDAFQRTIADGYHPGQARTAIAGVQRRLADSGTSPPQ